MHNITVKRCNVLNPVTLLPTEGDCEKHNFVVPITDFELFVDGVCTLEEKWLHVHRWGVGGL